MGTRMFIILFLTILPYLWAMEYKNNGGYKIPVVGLGTFTVTNEEELTNAINKALEIGYRHIDTAAVYKNEHIIGKVLNEWISSGRVKREDLFITTKLGCFDLYPDRVEEALNTSLKKLQLDYVDLYLIHFPVTMKVIDAQKIITQPTDLVAIWKKMEEQVDAGRSRTIGLSNFNISQIERIQKVARIQPANLQIELNVYFQQHELRDFAEKNNITVVAYSPIGAPGINKYYKQGHRTEIKLPDLLHDPTVEQIAIKHNKSIAQVLLRFLIQLNAVVIPKSTNEKRLKENFNVFDFNLDQDDMNSLKNLDKGKKAKIFTMEHLAVDITKHPEFPFHENIEQKDISKK